MDATLQIWRRRVFASFSGAAAEAEPPQTGLIAWFRADTEVTEGTGGVSAWGDPVGGFDLAQATEANRPALVAAVINGQPVIRFTRANADHLARATTPTPVQPYTWVMVAALTTGSAIFQWAVSDGASFRSLGYNNSDQPAIFSGGVVADDVASDGNFHALIGVFNGASSEIFVDNASVVTGDAGAGNFSGGIVVGAGPSASDPLGGDIAEVLLYDHVLDASERTALDTYFAARYGI